MIKSGNQLSVQKEKALKSVLIVFVVVMLILIGVLISEVMRNGITPMIAVPIALVPIFVINLKKVKAIRNEIKLRNP